ncbi:hypothetical protein FRB98_005749 [Tulasnella sp. 332]|nr:hypothetical protein FRB98_005749 [Tulasnella sp. 332]
MRWTDDKQGRQDFRRLQLSCQLARHVAYKADGEDQQPPVSNLLHVGGVTQLLGPDQFYQTLRENKLIFHAKDSGKDVFIKFTRNYSCSLREICAKHELASALLGYDELAGRWIMTVMEHLDHKVFKPAPLLKDEERHNISGLLRAAVKVMVGITHAERDDHGDIRDTNS